MSYIDKVKEYIPYYWPLSIFVHHNPLHGFEKMHFRKALKEASYLFDAKVYMEPSYYVDFYKEGVIKRDILEKNLMEFLQQINLEKYFPYAKMFITEISQDWMKFLQKTNNIEDTLINYFRQKIDIPIEELFEELISPYMFSELLDITFDKNITDIIQKEIVEFVSRFLDEGQTTMSMPERERGMFEAFKLYESINLDISSKDYIEYALNTLKIENKERYIFNHLIKDFGWSAFIKYREENEDYYFQQIYRASLEDYIAIRLFFELKYIKTMPIRDFEAFKGYFEKYKYYVVLKLLKAKNLLSPKYIDMMEEGVNPEKIYKSYIEEKIILEASRIKNISKALLMEFENQEEIIEFTKLIEHLKEEEGYIWLKSLEDSYIKDYVREFLHEEIDYHKHILASAVFCIDVRSESIRRHIEMVGNYTTYGIAGFFGTPIAFIEFDKGHEQFLCPAVIKPTKVIFELPGEEYKEYEVKHNINYTFKKILDKLKNNPYTPFFMVEAMGWIFGVNLFGKTLFPKLTLKFTSFIKAKKPKTILTVDKLSEEEINLYTQRFFIEKIQQAYYEEYKKHITTEEASKILKDILEEKETTFTKYGITKDQYEFQRQKLSNVGYSKEEQIELVYRFLKLIGASDKLPKFMFLIAHGSVSDNNPFESALDCGACGGNNGLANVRVLANIANRDYVKKALLEKNIDITNTIFIPAIHITTTDEIEFYDTDIIPKEDVSLFDKITKDFKIASKRTREERAKLLPYASEDKIFIRSIDWSETRPEWGLSRNMGVYVGPRRSIQNLILKNRFFMQSYDWRIDYDNKILETILSGPFIIGEWINMEHYFSTVDNEKFGAGSKVYHNVVSKVGVWIGNYGDIKTGLPYQTVFKEDKPFHEPIRLLTFIEAPTEKVLQAAQNVEEALGLVLNEWVRLIIIDKTKNQAFSIKNGQLELLYESNKSMIY